MGGLGRLWKRFAEGPAKMMRGVFPSAWGDPPVRGLQDLLEGYESMPWLRAASDKVATSVACLEVQLFSLRKGGKAYRDPVVQRAAGENRWKLLSAARRDRRLQQETEHVFLEALENPNPFMGRMGLVKITNIHLDLVGESFWAIDRNGLGKPAGFWPVPPHWVLDRPIPSRDTYRVAYKNWQVELPASEVIAFHDPSPANPYARGSGIGWSLGDEFEIDEYAAKMAKQLFFNSARPDFVVMGDYEEAEMRRLERKWLAHLQGFYRAHKPYFLTGKVEFHEFKQQTVEQLTLPALRKAERDIIIQVWGIPPEMFGIAEAGNLARTDYEAAEYMFAKQVTAPRLERMRGPLQRFVAAEYDERLVVSFPNPVARDKQHALAVAKSAPHAIEADEIRALAELEPWGGERGRAVMVPLNSYPTSDLLDQTQRPEMGRASSGRRAEDEGASS